MVRLNAYGLKAADILAAKSISNPDGNGFVYLGALAGEVHGYYLPPRLRNFGRLGAANETQAFGIGFIAGDRDGEGD